jgi:hypothetical protein
MDSHLQNFRARSEFFRVRTIVKRATPFCGKPGEPIETQLEQSLSKRKTVLKCSFVHPPNLGVAPITIASCNGEIAGVGRAFDRLDLWPNTPARFRICEKAVTNP